MGWLPAGDGYEVALVEGRVTARTTSGRSAGRELRSLPRQVRDHPEAERLRRLAEWLPRHAAECRARVESWMVCSLPVPTVLLAEVWPDDAWRSALRDLVVAGETSDHVGFLRDVTGDGGLRVVNLDGETVGLSPPTVTLPHPVVLPRLEELRDAAAELGVVQRVEQLHRATWDRPAHPGLARVTEFSGVRYFSRSALAARATRLGYRVSGGYALCPARDTGRAVEAAVWIGEPSRDGEAETGDLTWHGPDGGPLPPSEVGPVAWSEGMRMATALHAAGAPETRSPA